MNSALSSRLPLKMLHRIGDVHFLAINPGFFECLIHDFPCRSDEWFACDIFVITRLFADEHNRRALWAFSKHRLRGALVKMTRRAFARRLAHLVQTGCIWRPRRSRVFFVVRWHPDYESKINAELYVVVAPDRNGDKVAAVHPNRPYQNDARNISPHS